MKESRFLPKCYCLCLRFQFKPQSAFIFIFIAGGERNKKISFYNFLVFCCCFFLIFNNTEFPVLSHLFSSIKEAFKCSLNELDI